MPLVLARQRKRLAVHFLDRDDIPIRAARFNEFKGGHAVCHYDFCSHEFFPGWEREVRFGGVAVQHEFIGDFGECSSNVVDAPHLAWSEVWDESQGDGICCGGRRRDSQDMYVVLFYELEDCFYDSFSFAGAWGTVD